MHFILSIDSLRPNWRRRAIAALVRRRRYRTGRGSCFAFYRSISIFGRVITVRHIIAAVIRAVVRRSCDHLRRPIKVPEVWCVAAAVAHAIVIQVIWIRPLEPACRHLRRRPLRPAVMASAMPTAVPMRRVKPTPLVYRPPRATMVARPVGSNACGASNNNCQRADTKLKNRSRRKANHRLSPFSTELAYSFMLISGLANCEFRS